MLPRRFEETNLHRGHRDDRGQPHTAPQGAASQVRPPATRSITAKNTVRHWYASDRSKPDGNGALIPDDVSDKPLSSDIAACRKNTTAIRHLWPPRRLSDCTARASAPPAIHDDRARRRAAQNGVPLRRVTASSVAAATGGGLSLSTITPGSFDRGHGPRTTRDTMRSSVRCTREIDPDRRASAQHDFGLVAICADQGSRGMAQRRHFTSALEAAKDVLDPMGPRQASIAPDRSHRPLAGRLGKRPEERSTDTPCRGLDQSGSLRKPPDGRDPGSRPSRLSRSPSERAVGAKSPGSVQEPGSPRHPERSRCRLGHGNTNRSRNAMGAMDRDADATPHHDTSISATRLAIALDAGLRHIHREEPERSS